ncbi:hypothetical protein Emag_000425 [Eimeria magna]
MASFRFLTIFIVALAALLHVNRAVFVDSLRLESEAPETPESDASPGDEDKAPETPAPPAGQENRRFSWGRLTSPIRRALTSVRGLLTRRTAQRAERDYETLEATAMRYLDCFSLSPAGHKAYMGVTEVCHKQETEALQRNCSMFALLIAEAIEKINTCLRQENVNSAFEKLRSGSFLNMRAECVRKHRLFLVHPLLHEDMGKASLQDYADPQGWLEGLQFQGGATDKSGILADDPVSLAFRRLTFSVMGSVDSQHIMFGKMLIRSSMSSQGLKRRLSNLWARLRRKHKLNLTMERINEADKQGSAEGKGDSQGGNLQSLASGEGQVGMQDGGEGAAGMESDGSEGVDLGSGNSDTASADLQSFSEVPASSEEEMSDFSGDKSNAEEYRRKLRISNYAVKAASDAVAYARLSLRTSTLKLRLVKVLLKNKMLVNLTVKILQGFMGREVFTTSGLTSVAQSGKRGEMIVALYVRALIQLLTGDPGLAQLSASAVATVAKGGGGKVQRREEKVTAFVQGDSGQPIKRKPKKKIAILFLVIEVFIVAGVFALTTILPHYVLFIAIVYTIIAVLMHASHLYAAFKREPEQFADDITEEESQQKLPEDMANNP